MLFEVLLIIGATLAPISMPLFAFSDLYQNRTACKVAIWMVAVSLACFILAWILPPIPIIPQ